MSQPQFTKNTVRTGNGGVWVDGQWTSIAVMHEIYFKNFILASAALYLNDFFSFFIFEIFDRQFYLLSRNQSLQQ